MGTVKFDWRGFGSLSYKYYTIGLVLKTPRTSKIVLSSGLLALLIGTIASPASATPSDPSIPTPGQVQTPSATLLDARAQLAALQERSSIEVEAYNQAIVDKEAADLKAAELEAASEAAQAEVKDAKEALGRYAADVYKSGGSSHNQLRDATSLISSDKAATLPRQMAVAGYVQERKAGTVVDLKSAEALALSAASEAKTAKEAASAAAAVAEEAALQTQKTIDEAAVALAVLESDELERERLAAEEAQAAADYAAWESAQTAARVAQGGTDEPSVTPIAPVGASAYSSAALEFAFAQIGKPYVWGATGPDGFDCSGLTGASYAAAGVSLPRTSGAQAGAGTPVALDAMLPGDLVFFGSPVHHVGIYVGDNMIVHAPKPGDVVKVSKIWTPPSSAVRVG